MGLLFKVLRSRNFQVAAISVYIIVLTAVTALFLHEIHLNPIPLIIIEVISAAVLSLFVERVTSSARSVAFLLARNVEVAVISFSVLAAGALVAFLLGPSPTVRSSPIIVPQVAAIMLYLTLGLLLGASIRSRAGDLIARALFGMPRFRSSIELTSIWFFTAVTALLPVHRNAMVPFLLGVGSGILLHQSLTLRLAQGVAAQRRLFEVQSNLPDTLPLPETERTALKLLAQGRQLLSMRFTRLRTHVENCQERNAMSKRLHLLSACAWRLEGRYNDAIKDTHHASSPPTDNVDAQLLLIRALSLEDRDDSANDEIDCLIASLTSSLSGRTCPLTKALQARRSAERSIDSARGTIVFSKTALELVVASLDLRRGAWPILEEALQKADDEANEFFRGFVAHGVPVTPSWLLDVFGYALLVAGCPQEGRVFLQRCISLDPAYSYAYLHLGDYFLFRRTATVAGGNRAAPGKTGTWHARACYLLADRIERSRASRVRRIAHGRLELVERLLNNMGDAKD
jgi:hypothetical protein